MSVNQNEIDALLAAGGHDDDASETKSKAPVESGSDSSKSEKKSTAKNTAEAKAANPEPDTSTLNTDDTLEQMRSAQKILFEVFSSIPDRKERTRLLNWANDAFIKSKFF